jgi:type I restriction enzyme R subunit
VVDVTQFRFLEREWPDVGAAAARAESAAHPDPRTACFYARRALELAVAWAYKHDASLRLPYQDNLSALIHEPTFKKTAGEAVFSKARVITTLNRCEGNLLQGTTEAGPIVGASSSN